MKKFILLFCFIFISGNSYSQIFSEDFIYPPGTLLTSTGFWFAASAGGTNPITALSPGLVFPSYIGSGIGNAAFVSTTGEDDSSVIVPLQTTGSVYASFMLRVDFAQATGDYFFALSTTGNAFDARVYVRLSGSGFNLGITKANEATINYGPAVYNYGTTYLVIDKYQFNGGLNDDQVSLFVFDSTMTVPSTEPVPTIGPISATSVDAINISRVILRQGSAANAARIVIDGIYIDNSWNNAVLPVELTSFVSDVNRNNVSLNWSTASEHNNKGFEIERNTGGYWERIGFTPGSGTTINPQNYSFSDRGLNSGVYEYRLKQIDFNGNFEFFNLSSEVSIGVPGKFDLSQNYPNPFNPSTNIDFDIPLSANASLKIYDLSGKEAAEIFNEFKTAGFYSVKFNAANLSSGLYFYRLNSGNFTSTKKMILLK